MVIGLGWKIMLRLVGKGNGYCSCDWLVCCVFGGNWIGLVNYATTAGRKPTVVTGWLVV